MGTRHAAVTNLGVRPTVEEAGALWVESYLLDFSGDLYGQELTVTLCSFLRPERRFPDVEALRQGHRPKCPGSPCLTAGRR